MRGNEITLTGVPGDTAFAVRVLDELIALVRRGQTLRPDEVRRVVSTLSAVGKIGEARPGPSVVIGGGGWRVERRC